MQKLSKNLLCCFPNNQVKKRPKSVKKAIFLAIKEPKGHIWARFEGGKSPLKSKLRII
jgi:hypothetical protein